MISTAEETVTTGDWFVRRFGLTWRRVAQPGQGDRLVQLLLASGDVLAKATGCYVYLVGVSPADPDAVWVTEVWRSRDHRQAALDRPASRRLHAEIEVLIASEDEPIHTIPIGGKGLLSRYPVR